MHRHLTELIGTFFLVATIGFTAATGSAMAPLAIGSILMVMVYMGGHLSGGHYNPAVSLAVYLSGGLDTGGLVGYWVSQVVGGLLAALAVWGIAGSTFAPAPGSGVATTSVVLAEVLFTFALALVVLNSALSAGTKGNSFYGLAIGFTVGAGAWAVGPISGAAFNPAVGIGPTGLHAAVGGGGWDALWIYVVAPLAGGALAAPVFGLQESGVRAGSAS